MTVSQPHKPWHSPSKTGWIQELLTNSDMIEKDDIGQVPDVFLVAMAQLVRVITTTTSSNNSSGSNQTTVGLCCSHCHEDFTHHLHQRQPQAIQRGMMAMVHHFTGPVYCHACPFWIREALETLEARNKNNNHNRHLTERFCSIFFGKFRKKLQQKSTALLLSSRHDGADKTLILKSSLGKGESRNKNNDNDNQQRHDSIGVIRTNAKNYNHRNNGGDINKMTKPTESITAEAAHAKSPVMSTWPAPTNIFPRQPENGGTCRRALFSTPQKRKPNLITPELPAKKAALEEVIVNDNGSIEDGTRQLLPAVQPPPLLGPHHQSPPAVTNQIKGAHSPGTLKRKSASPSFADWKKSRAKYSLAERSKKRSIAVGPTAANAKRNPCIVGHDVGMEEVKEQSTNAIEHTVGGFRITIATANHLSKTNDIQADKGAKRVTIAPLESGTATTHPTESFEGGKDFFPPDMTMDNKDSDVANQSVTRADSHSNSQANANEDQREDRHMSEQSSPNKQEDQEPSEDGTLYSTGCLGTAEETRRDHSEARAVTSPALDHQPCNASNGKDSLMKDDTMNHRVSHLEAMDANAANGGGEHEAALAIHGRRLRQDAALEQISNRVDKPDASWLDHYCALLIYHREFETFTVKSDHSQRLNLWAWEQRANKSELSGLYRATLQSIGFFKGYDTDEAEALSGTIYKIQKKLGEKAPTSEAVATLEPGEIAEEIPTQSEPIVLHETKEKSPAEVQQEPTPKKLKVVNQPAKISKGNRSKPAAPKKPHAVVANPSEQVPKQKPAPLDASGDVQTRTCPQQESQHKVARTTGTNKIVQYRPQSQPLRQQQPAFLQAAAPYLWAPMMQPQTTPFHQLMTSTGTSTMDLPLPMSRPLPVPPLPQIPMTQAPPARMHLPTPMMQPQVNAAPQQRDRMLAAVLQPPAPLPVLRPSMPRQKTQGQQDLEELEGRRNQKHQQRQSTLEVGTPTIVQKTAQTSDTTAAEIERKFGKAVAQAISQGTLLYDEAKRLLSLGVRWTEPETSWNDNYLEVLSIRSAVENQLAKKQAVQLPESVFGKAWNWMTVNAHLGEKNLLSPERREKIRIAWSMLSELRNKVQHKRPLRPLLPVPAQVVKPTTRAASATTLETHGHTKPFATGKRQNSDEGNVIRPPALNTGRNSTDLRDDGICAPKSKQRRLEPGIACLTPYQMALAVEGKLPYDVAKHLIEQGGRWKETDQAWQRNFDSCVKLCTLLDDVARNGEQMEERFPASIFNEWFSWMKVQQLLQTADLLCPKRCKKVVTVFNKIRFALQQFHSTAERATTNAATTNPTLEAAPVAESTPLPEKPTGTISQRQDKKPAPFADSSHALAAHAVRRASSTVASASVMETASQVAAEKDDQLDKEDQMGDEEYFKAFALKEGKSEDESFPHKLYRMLYEAEQDGHARIVSFLPSGCSFTIHNPKEFVCSIMPRYFTTRRVDSFLRQLHLYGFRRIPKGKEKGAYFHKDFVTGKRYRIQGIKRKSVSTASPDSGQKPKQYSVTDHTEPSNAKEKNYIDKHGAASICCPSPPGRKQDSVADAVYATESNDISTVETGPKAAPPEPVRKKIAGSKRKRIIDNQQDRRASKDEPREKAPCTSGQPQVDAPKTKRQEKSSNSDEATASAKEDDSSTKETKRTLESWRDHVLVLVDRIDFSDDEDEQKDSEELGTAAEPEEDDEEWQRRADADIADFRWMRRRELLYRQKGLYPSLFG